MSRNEIGFEREEKRTSFLKISRLYVSQPLTTAFFFTFTGFDNVLFFIMRVNTVLSINEH
jgi:hypothetical protein